MVELLIEVRVLIDEGLCLRLHLNLPGEVD
jgi:hypothetical protein